MSNTTTSTELSVKPTMAAMIAAAPAADEAVFKDMAKRGDYLGRLQLYSKGDAINRRLIAPGEFGIPRSEDDIVVLGDNVDLLPLTRRVKAVDMSDRDAIVTVYDVNDPEFVRIKDKSGESNSHCMYGISFLVIERSTGEFLEYFAGTKTLRGEAGKIYPFLPGFERIVDKKTGEVTQGEYLPPRPFTMTSKVIKTPDFSWHGVKISECSTPFSDLPSDEAMAREVQKFLNPKTEKVEKVDEQETNRSNKRRR